MKRKQKRKASFEAGEALGESPVMTVQAVAGSFQGTDTTRDRGLIYCPTLDSKREVDSWSRIELNKRTNVLYNSGGGLFHRLVNGVSNMVVGTGLIPHPTPIRVKGREQKTREWVHNVRRLFMDRCGSALVYDMAKRRNVFQDQRLAQRLEIKDGDSAKIMVRDVETGRLRSMRYEANQIGNGPRAEPDKRWMDGVLCGRFNEMLKLRLLSTDELGVVSSVDVDAGNVLMYMNDERLRQVRGLTAFYPVINKCLDRGEILYALTKGIKVASQPAYVIEQAAPISTVPGAASYNPKGTTKVSVNGKDLTFQEFLNGGEAWNLQAGQSFRVVQSQSPHPNVVAHLDGIVRDVCYAIGIAPEIGWNVIDAGGANMRFILAEMAQFIEIKQDSLIDADFGPYYVAWLYDMIQAGEVEEIPGWERHVWIAPARLTADFGRDGKLYLDELKRGVRSMQSMYGMRGEIAEIGIDEYLDERQHIIQGIHNRKIVTENGERSMTFDEAFPELRQSALDSTAAEMADRQAEALESAQASAAELRQLVDFARETKG